MAQAPTEPNAAVLVLGTEILRGDILDTNSEWLAQELFELGVRTDLIMTLPDSVDEVVQCFGPLAPRYDYILCSGGIGPTPDDLTREIVSELTGRGLEESPSALQQLDEFYRGELTEIRRRMANLPAGADPIPARGSGIPGFQVENYYCFPGVPELLHQMFDEVKEVFRSSPFHRRELMTRIGESSFAHLLQEAESRFPELSVGSYPRFESEWKSRVIVRGKKQEAVEECVEFLDRELDALAEELRGTNDE